jgi:polyisoprenoid-binding protein YceI
MKYSFMIALSALVLSLPTQAQAATYKLDPTHSFVEFKIKHLGYSWLLGRFNEMEGEFTYDAEGDPEDQSISVTVDTATIDSNHAERDKHLNEIIDSGEFGKATFKSKRYDGDASGGIMYGKLTIHGVTKDVAIPIQKIGEGGDPWGGYRAGFEGELIINRKDFGIDYDLGPQSWDVILGLYVEGIKQ